MRSKLEKGFDIKDIILISIILILIIVNLMLYLKEILIPKQQEQENEYKISTTIEEDTKKNTQTINIPKTDEEIIKKLSTLGERDRMEYYCGVYFKHLEKKEYEEAYSLLYKDFKEKYFPTIESYKEYVSKIYPQNMVLEYNDITRQGSIYVLRLDVIDILKTSEEKFSQRIVIKENTYNDFVISFQVI